MHTDEQQVNDVLFLKTDSHNGKKKKQIPISTTPLFYSEAERVRHEYYREKIICNANEDTRVLLTREVKIEIYKSS